MESRKEKAEPLSRHGRGGGNVSSSIRRNLLSKQRSGPKHAHKRI